ncbi:MAG: enoyl-CoA hydratase/isomerase family protein [Acidimicrobiia bacterium]
MADVTGDAVVAETHGRLRVLRMNRPDKKNAINGALMTGLHRELTAAAADDDVWAIALTGNGDAFCAGLDFTDPPKSAEGAPRGHLTVLMRVECEKPILAGVNGVAVGGGLSIALNADIRIAAPSARFHPGYTRIAVSPDLGLTVTLPRAVGYERAMRFMLENRTVHAPEALALGLVSEVVARDEDLDARLLEYGALLASAAPVAARQTKRLFTRAETLDLGAHLDLENELVIAALASQDSNEAIRAMMTGESPTFTGR